MLDDAARIEAVVGLLARLAAGDLKARGLRSVVDDDFDAVIEGINMLAEDLEASHAELERRVQERTAELEVINADMLRLTELGNLLAACETSDEAYAMTRYGLAEMFGAISGTMYLYKASRNVLEVHATWGSHPSSEPLDPRGCWALRRGHVHFVDYEAASLACPHIEERTGDTLCIPMSAHGETIGMLHLRGRRGETGGRPLLTPGKRQLAIAVAEQVSLALANIDLRERLRSQALRDPLTGLHNRRFADEWIEQEAARSDRRSSSLGLIMVDLDHFKQLNDVHGHDAGDAMLQAVARTFETSLRPDDMPCRYGGEEFVVLVSDIDLPTLVQRAEALRAQVAALEVDFRGSKLPRMTMSAGVATYPEHGRSPQELVKAADAALYAAKRLGRNRVETAS